MQGVQPPQGDYVTRSDMATLLSEAMLKAEQARANNEILQRLKALEEGEEEEEESEGEEMLDRVNGLLDRFENLGKSSKKKQPAIAQPEAVNGVEDISKKVGRDVKANINKAITELYKFDKDLDTDLLKLAKIAKEDTAQFNMFINALRKM